MPKITIDNFSGGLNTGEPTAIADNQLAVAENVSYDNQGILGVRRGIKNFGNEISGADGVSSIYFTKFTDGTRILLCAEGTTMYRYNEGTEDWDSIKTGLTSDLDYSFITYKDLVYAQNGTDSCLIIGEFAYLVGGTGATSTVSTWTAVSDGAFKITLGSTTHSIIGLDFTSDTSLDDICDTIRTGLVGLGEGDFSVAWVSDHFEIARLENPDNESIGTLTAGASGTDISGAGGTPFLNANTGNGSPFSSGINVTQTARIVKGKYMVVESDVIYIAGISDDPSTVFYTETNPDTVNSDGFANFEPVNQDEGIITGLAPFGALLVVGKDKGVYLLNIGTSPVSTSPLDFDGDVQSHRSMVNVENDLLFMSDRGVYSMAQRQGTTASYRAFPWSNSIDKEIKAIDDKSSCVAIYYPKMNNVYFAVDSGEVNQNDKMFVYSTLVSQPGRRQFTWTEYLNINANDFTVYEDSSGDEHLLVANSFGGQIIEMEAENQFTDEGLEIGATIRTKTFDFGVPEAYKLFEQVNLVGFITENEEVTFTLDTDGTSTSKTFTGAEFAVGDDADDFPLGEEDLGIDPVGSGPVGDDGLTYYPFTQRRSYFKYGLRLTVQIETNSVNSGLKITKLSIPVEAMDDTAFPTSFYTT